MGPNVHLAPGPRMTHDKPSPIPHGLHLYDRNLSLSLLEDKGNESWVAMRLPLAGRASQEPGSGLQLSSLLGSRVY